MSHTYTHRCHSFIPSFGTKTPPFYFFWGKFTFSFFSAILDSGNVPFIPESNTVFSLLSGGYESIVRTEHHHPHVYSYHRPLGYRSTLLSIPCTICFVYIYYASKHYPPQTYLQQPYIHAELSFVGFNTKNHVSLVSLGIFI